jgi:KDO2-lipid IV(A) lauroyltransferase
MNFVNFIFFYLFSSLIGLLPFRALYGLSDFTAFVLKSLGYRKAVIISNLKGSFPDMDSETSARIISRFYKNLSDILIEGIKAFRMRKGQILKRYRIKNAELITPYLEAGKGVIVVTGHYCNWEWGALAPPLQIPFGFVGFYKPVKNPLLDSYVRSNRSRFGTYLSPIRETTKSFEDRKGMPGVYLMAADQSPSNREMAIWADFLNRDTAFLHGPEKHARNNNYPVVFAAIRRLKRGYYELELSVLSEDTSDLPYGEITKRYAAAMESIIREDPANWLWSHKRWKLTR